MRMALLLAGLCLSTPVSHAQIALLAAFEHPCGSASTEAMGRELIRLFALAGSEIAVHQDAPKVYLGSPRHVLYVAFTGRCEFTVQIAPRTSQRVLARLATVDGKLQPLMTVDCDAVAETIASHMAGGDLKRGDELLGRALGRVIAHEIFHWVAHQVNHNHSELFSEAMSARTLLADHATFDPGELQLLRVNR
ncbi:MAG: hypothetical protein IPJ98_24990 [Bryobacterales bacterium]|nr:hypothetical protein [Bryobacterales bacterium]